MSDLSDLIDSLSPYAYWRLNETSGGPVDSAGNLATGAYNNGPLLNQAGLTGDGDACVDFDGSNQYAYIDGGTPVSPIFNASGFTMLAWLRADTGLRWQTVCTWKGKDTAGKHANIRFSNTNILRFYVASSPSVYTLEQADAAIDPTAGNLFVAAVFDAGTITLYVDGAAIASTTSTSGGGLSAMPDDAQFEEDEFYIASTNDPASYFDGKIDDVAVFATALTAQNIADIHAEAGGSSGPQSLPTLLQGYITSPAVSLPTRFRGGTAASPASLPVYCQAPDPTHYTAGAARWSAAVTLDDVDISSQLTGAVQVEAEESSSGICQFTLIPAAGSVDPNDYERKPVTVTFIGRDSAGATLYTSRRFTGTTTVASYNPDTGLMSVRASNDLQGRLENISRAAIDGLVGGQWSEHVFDDAADGWQYAQDRLSTRPAEFHVNHWGQIVVSDWAAKTVPDVTFTDASRFRGTLRLTRNSRRDLITRNTVNLDFRFVRLRHREMNVVFVYDIGFCGYLDGQGTIPQRSTILSAADSNGWTRTSDVNFTALPDVGTYCSGKNWVGGADEFCIGADWKAARRWAQTITEEYALTVTAPDLEEAVGVQAVSESYGIEATYDASDYENIKDFDSIPATAVLSSKTNDYQVEADQAEADGRAAMEAAQACALAKVSVEILKRARGNRVSVGAVYDPAISLASTVRINTPSLVTKGKVFSYTERLDLESGNPEMSIDLAISRHGGSGSAVDSPLDAATQPEQADETSTARSYYLGCRSGGTTNAPADDETWDGWITNKFGPARTDPTNLYTERFVVAMPEIEKTARDATVAAKSATYTVAVPQDELTLSY